MKMKTIELYIVFPIYLQYRLVKALSILIKRLSFSLLGLNVPKCQ